MQPKEANGPITSAVYGRRAARPSKPKRERRPVVTLVGALLGEEQVTELYSKLGFQRPQDRPRKRISSTTGRATK